jgi:glycosyltransferase involved in cell wall biosynthesis
MGLSGVQRTLKFVKYMRNYNWEPTVITTNEVGYFAQDNILEKELNETGVRVVRVRGSKLDSLLSRYRTVKLPREFVRKLFNRLGQILFIPDNKISWSKAAVKKAIELIENEHFDAIFISGPPFSPFDVFGRNKNKFNIPLVLDYTDLWVDYQFSFYLTPFHRLLNKKKEHRALKASHKVIVTNRRVKEKIINEYKFLSFNDVFIIPHGYDPEDFQKVVPEQKPNDKLIITYAGLFYEYITPKYFLLAFRKLLKEHPEIAENIRLNFIGFLRKENQRLIKKLKIDGYVREYGYLNHHETIQKLLMSDILWLMIGKGKSASTISSSKLFEYFGTKKPIIACIPEGALKNFAADYKASFITDPYDIEQIKNVFVAAYWLFKEDKLPKPDEDFIETFRRDYLTEQLTKQMNNILKVSVS